MRGETWVIPARSKRAAGRLLGMVLGLMVTACLVPAHRVDPTTLPACATEDGPGPCYWDAPNRGTGEGYGKGQSFWVDRDQRVHYIDGSTR